MANTEENIIDFSQVLYKKVKTTMQSRYYSSAFYDIRDKYSIASQGFLSAYIIIINFLPSGIIAPHVITFFTIALSILMLVLSQIESHAGYKLLASRLHNCGKELRILETELLKIIHKKDCQSLDQEKLVDDILISYNHILSKYQENHNPISYQKVLTIMDRNNYSFFTRHFINLRYLLMPRLLYILLIFIPPILITVIYVTK
ncbi:MAG: SLATT domain-containing protein [Melioribacteraceae bacterium]|nr:SLATT domain-containing protein [Melioribacteraceae bacterium]